MNSLMITFVGGPLDGKAQPAPHASASRGLPDVLYVAVEPTYVPDDPHDPRAPIPHLGAAPPLDPPHLYHLRRQGSTGGLVYVHASRLPSGG